MTVSNQSDDPVTWYAEIPHRDSNPPDIAAYLGAGGTSSTCGSPNGTGFGYDGNRDDPETGLYQTGPRHYDLRLRRVLQSDPIGQTGGLLLYAYGGNDPLNGIIAYGRAVRGLKAHRCDLASSSTPSAVIDPGCRRRSSRAGQP